MLPYLTGRRDQIHDDDDSMGWELFGRTAFRRGKWKITWIEKPFGSSDFELFDIESDPGESLNVRSTFPDVYARMVDGFEEYARSNGIIIARPPPLALTLDRALNLATCLSSRGWLGRCPSRRSS